METYRQDLIPPDRVILEYSGGISREQFISSGNEVLQQTLIKLAGLQPNHNFLDIGCGCGKLARPLAEFLDKTGSYYGMDIAWEPIDWCREKYREFSNFHFDRVDIYSSRYNPEGKYKSENYVFPHPDNFFDAVFLGSVFTHMLPSQVKNYLHEIWRMLKPHGKCIATYFLLDEESLRNVQANLTSPLFSHEFGLEGCRIEVPHIPEAAIAYDEKYITLLHQEYGLPIKQLGHGEWGRGKLIPHWQDLVLAEKENTAMASSSRLNKEAPDSILRDLAARLDQLSDCCARLEVRLQQVEQSLPFRLYRRFFPSR